MTEETFHPTCPRCSNTMQSFTVAAGEEGESFIESIKCVGWAIVICDRCALPFEFSMDGSHRLRKDWQEDSDIVQAAYGVQARLIALEIIKVFCSEEGPKGPDDLPLVFSRAGQGVAICATLESVRDWLPHSELGSRLVEAALRADRWRWGVTYNQFYMAVTLLGLPARWVERELPGRSVTIQGSRS